MRRTRGDRLRKRDWRAGVVHRLGDVHGHWLPDRRCGVTEEGVVELTIRPTVYRIVHRPNVGQGHISVRGDEITFLSSNLCDDRGTFRWALDGDKLTFTSVGTRDTCGRAEVLDKRTYTLVSH